MPLRVVNDLDELRSLVGQEVAVSDWIEITQERVNQFAEATGDHQWIHIDEQRAKKESPYGTTIAHGYLTLSLLPMLSTQSFQLKNGPAMTINYGANRVRFPNAVRVGSKVRLKLALASMEPLEGAWQVTWNATIEIEGQPKPALAAETLSRYYPKPQ
jgi:acyl dehydratase